MHIQPYLHILPFSPSLSVYQKKKKKKSGLRIKLRKEKKTTTKKKGMTLYGQVTNKKKKSCPVSNPPTPGTDKDRPPSKYDPFRFMLCVSAAVDG